jgi:hypothetical protein
LGDGDKVIEIVYGDGEMSLLERPKQKKNLLYYHDKLNEPIKEAPLSFVLFDFPFTSVSTVSRGHHSSLVSVAMPG